MKTIKLYHYNAVREIVKASKKNNIEAINIISDSIAYYIIKNNIKGVIIPVPSSQKSTEKIARLTAIKTNRLYCNSLFKFKAPSNCKLRMATNSRKTLSISEIQKYMRVRKYPENKNLILIDDVCTSGNTIEACKRKLQGYKITAIAYANGNRKKGVRI